MAIFTLLSPPPIQHSRPSRDHWIMQKTKKMHEWIHWRLRLECNDAQSWVTGVSSFWSWISKQKKRKMVRPLIRWILDTDETITGQRSLWSRSARQRPMHGKWPAQDQKFELASGKFMTRLKTSASSSIQVLKKWSKTSIIKQAWSQAFCRRSATDPIPRLDSAKKTRWSRGL